NYVDEVNSTELTDSAIKGMLTNLDPYSVYLRPDQFKELEIDTFGEFGGIGIEVTDKNGKLTIISAIEGTPASKAGIKSADIIVSVDGNPTKGMNSYDVIKTLRGPIGSEVTLEIFSPSSNKNKEYKLKREKIKVLSVKQELLDGNIAYIKLLQFQKNSHEDFLNSYRTLNSKSSNNLQGLIIDLRNNPGGLLDQAIEIADDFMDGGLIVSVKGRNYNQSKDYYANKNTNIDLKNTVIIVNKGSASASEVLAGALKDNSLAKVVGEKTFGKGSVQAIVELDDGSGVKLTTARFYTPNGSVINNVGISPDVVVENKKKKDRQLESAIELIRGI
ncbi:MAG: S41 family peptidase, partial [Thermodesulfobacteriota bacterium]